MFFISLWGALLALINALIWQRYYACAHCNGLPPQARAELKRVLLPLRLIGHITPLVLFAIATATPFSETLLNIAGIAAVAGGVMWKYTVIVRASYQQGFALPKMPQRGSGTRAAPNRMEGLAARPQKEA